MGKGIGSRVYDPEKSEMICEIDDGKIYRKRSHDREWFAVFDNGAIRPLDENEPRDKELIDIGQQHVSEDSAKSRTTIWVDRETHERFAAAARKQKVSISEFLRQLAKRLMIF